VHGKADGRRRKRLAVRHLFCRARAMMHDKGCLPCVRCKAHNKDRLPCKILPRALCRASRRKTHGKEFAVRFWAFARAHSKPPVSDFCTACGMVVMVQWHHLL
jgi:hypothetical protein